MKPITTPLDVDALTPGIHRLGRVISPVADGGLLALPIIVLQGAAARPRLVAIGGVHGDEYEGPAALLDLADELDPASLAGTLVIVPIANPPAFRMSRRWNPTDGVNMNRIFPGDPNGSVTHRLAHCLVEEVVRGADFVVTIHAWSAGSLIVPYVEYTTGQKTSDASRLGAVALGLAYLQPLPMLPGRLISLAASMGIPACEAEIGGEGITLPERAAIGRRGIIGALRHLGILGGLVEHPAGQREVVRHELVSPIGGVLRRTARPVGELIAEGDLIATVCVLTREPLAELRAPTNGVLATLRHALTVDPGDLVAAIFSDRVG